MSINPQSSRKRKLPCWSLEAINRDVTSLKSKRRRVHETYETLEYQAKFLLQRYLQRIGQGSTRLVALKLMTLLIDSRREKDSLFSIKDFVSSQMLALGQISEVVNTLMDEYSMLLLFVDIDDKMQQITKRHELDGNGVDASRIWFGMPGINCPEEGLFLKNRMTTLFNLKELICIIVELGYPSFYTTPRQLLEQDDYDADMKLGRVSLFCKDLIRAETVGALHNCTEKIKCPGISISGFVSLNMLELGMLRSHHTTPAMLIKLYYQALQSELVISQVCPNWHNRLKKIVETDAEYKLKGIMTSNDGGDNPNWWTTKSLIRDFLAKGCAEEAHGMEKLMLSTPQIFNTADPPYYDHEGSDYEEYAVGDKIWGVDNLLDGVRDMKTSEEMDLVGDTCEEDDVDDESSKC